MKMRYAVCAALLLGMMSGACALADTPRELAQAAKERWQETITAYGREIVLDVQINVPDVEQIGVYHVTAVQGSEWDGEYVSREKPEKRRGIAYRTRPDEVFTPENVDPEYHAFGHADSAADVLARAQEAIAPYEQKQEGLAVEWTTLTGHSPSYVYNKNTGEWGDTAIEGDCGFYGISFAESLFGVPVDSLRLGNLGLFDRHAEEHAGIYAFTPDFCASYEVRTGFSMLNITVPCVQETLTESADLLPLEDIKGVLRDLAEQGLLRSVDEMELRMMSFAYVSRDADPYASTEEDTVYLLRPVWVCVCEIYQSAEEERLVYYGEEFDMRYKVAIDAQTGELIETEWILKP